MPFPGEVVPPALCAVLHTSGAIWLKRALGFGVGIWRATFVTNVLLGLVQKWAPEFGASRFFSLMFVLLVIGSGVFVPFFHGRLRDITLEGWKAMLPRSVAMCLGMRDR